MTAGLVTSPLFGALNFRKRTKRIFATAQREHAGLRPVRARAKPRLSRLASVQTSKSAFTRP
jgi:hypothetical protein